MDHRALFAAVRQRPSLYGLDGSFGQFTAYLSGVDAGTDGEALIGFREWLVVRLGDGDNLTWSGLALQLAFPGGWPGLRDRLADPEQNAVAVSTLFELLDEFLAERAKPDGPRERHRGFERRELPFVMVGKHRRVRRDDVEALLRPRQELTRDQLKSLWLHQAVAGALVTDPDEVLGKARDNLDRLLQQHRKTMTEVWLKRWQDKINEGVGPVLKVLMSEDAEAVELRQNSPFAGVLPRSQRQKVLESFKRSGRPGP